MSRCYQCAPPVIVNGAILLFWPCVDFRHIRQYMDAIPEKLGHDKASWYTIGPIVCFAISAHFDSGRATRLFVCRGLALQSQC